MDDVASFEDYVVARSAGLQRFAYLVCGDAGEAGELVQSALVGLYPRWAEVIERGDPEAYVRRSIVNAQVTAWRRRRRLEAVPAPVCRLSRCRRGSHT